mgnify:CR=1 FL=1
MGRGVRFQRSRGHPMDLGWLLPAGTTSRAGGSPGVDAEQQLDKAPYVRACVNCQDLYDEDMSPPKVPRDAGGRSGGRWSMQNGN